LGLFYSYKTAGSGISKNAKTKNRFVLFFNLYFRKFWNLIKLNLLYSLACIPIVTIGPATAAFTTVLKRYSMERHSYIWSDFWESFKKNFKQSFVVGIVDIILFIGTLSGILVYPKLSETSKLFTVALIISISIAVTLIIMNFYIFLMIVSLELSLKDIIKNAFILTCAALKENVITLLSVFLVAAAVYALMFFVDIFFVLLFALFLASFCGFIIVFNCYPIIQKYIINPYYESKGIENPENQYANVSEDEAIFKDNPEKEKPEKAPVKTPKNKKIIS